MSTSAFKALESAYSNRLAGAQRHKQSGGKVAGFVSTSVPVEVIEAAGFYPVMITGDQRDTTPLADHWMESTFDPMAHSILQAALAGDLQFLDVLVIPRTADSFMRLYLYLREIERQKLCSKLPREVVLWDLLQTSGESASRHNLVELRKLSETLARISGRGIVPQNLVQAVRDANSNRGVLQELLLRRRKDSQLVGEDVLAAITTRYLMPSNEHTAMLRASLESLPTVTKPIESPRVVVAGNAQDNGAFHRALASAGLHVVGDYHWLGDPCAVTIENVDSEDPLRAVAEHYHRRILTSRRFPHEPDKIVAHAKHCGAQAVVFYHFESEEALTWDCPNQVRALRDAGIETLVLDNQPHEVSSESLAGPLADWARRLRGQSR